MYQIGRLLRPRARLKLTAFCTLSRSFSSLIEEAIARGPLGVLRRHLDRARDGLVVGLRQRARARSGPSARSSFAGDLGGALAELERPHRVGGVHVHRAVACDARRPGVARDRGADGGRPALDELGHAGLRAEADELGAGSRYRADPCSTSTSCAGSTGSAERCVAVIIVCPMPANARREHLGAGRGRAPRARRRAAAAAASAAAPPRRGAARARRAAARPASRTGAGRGRRSRSARRRGAGRGPSRPRSMSRARRASSSSTVGGSRVVARAARRGRPSSAGALGERRARARRAPRGAASTSAAPSAATRSVHGSSASRPDEAELHAAQRGVSLRERREVVLRHAGARGEEPAEHAVEVRAARGRPALDDGQPVGGEDERRDLAAQRLGGREPGAVQARLLRLALAKRHARARAARRSRVAADHDAAGRLAEADQLRVLPRARREALRRDVQRLEQVRLADAVSPDDEHDPRREREVERRVRAVVAKGYAGWSDQPARRIGMIRYT